MGFGLEDGSECTGTSCTSLMMSESQNPHKMSVAGPGVKMHAFDHITQQAEAGRSVQRQLGLHSKFYVTQGYIMISFPYL